MGLFSRLFGGKDLEAPSAPGSSLRSYIDQRLPKSYTRSGKYAVMIQEAGGRASAKIVLDMLADGSDYESFNDADYAQVAEMESGYVLGGCVNKPPVPTDFTLELVFGDGRIITVAKRAGEKFATMTAQGKKREITF